MRALVLAFVCAFALDSIGLGPALAPMRAADGVQTGKILFTSDGVIFTAERDGSGVHRIGEGSNPAFSPDGLRIAFSAYDDFGNSFIYSVPVTGGARARESGPLIDPTGPPTDAAGPYDQYEHRLPRYRANGQGIVHFATEVHMDADGLCATFNEGFAQSSGAGTAFVKSFWSSCDQRPDDLCYPSGTGVSDFNLGGPWPATGSDPGAIAYDLTCQNSDPPTTAQVLRGGSSSPLLGEASLAGGWTPDGRVLLQRSDPDGIVDHLVSPDGQASPWEPPNPLYGRAISGCNTSLSSAPLGVVFSPDGKLSGWSEGAPESFDAPSPACTEWHAGIWLADASGANPRQVVEGETAVLHDLQCTPGNCLVGILVTKAFGPAATNVAFPVPFDYSGATSARRIWMADPFSLPYTDRPLLVRLQAGTHSITETQPRGWTLTGIACTGATSTVDLASRTVSVTLTGLTGLATCVFTSDWDGATPPEPIPSPSVPADGCSSDADADGYCDEIEVVYGSDTADGSSTPVTPPGYWEEDGHDKMGSVPKRTCSTTATIDFCKVQAGDVFVWRYSHGFNSRVERVLGDTYYTHALLVVGFWEMTKKLQPEVVPVLLDITPHPEMRSEMALWDATGISWSGPEDRPDAAAVFRSAFLTRPQREEVGRRGLRIAWDLGADADNNHQNAIWSAPSATYTSTPFGWGPDAYYCSSLVASAYGMDFDDFGSSRPFLGTAAFYVTPDDLLDRGPGLYRVMGMGLDGRGFSLWSPANLLLTDMDGNRTGRDADGTEYGEIPGALWRLEADNESVSAPEVTEDWMITVSGTGTGTYHLMTHGVGESAGSFILEGETSPGEIHEFFVGDLLSGEPAPVETSETESAEPSDGGGPPPDAGSTGGLVFVLVSIGAIAAISAGLFVKRRRERPIAPG